MLFNSVFFVLFFSIIAILYFIVPKNVKWLLLLVASVYFYFCWTPIHLVILFMITIISYFMGVLINQCNLHSERIKKKVYAATGIIGCLSVLIVYKYANFFISWFYMLTDTLHIEYQVPNFYLAVPVGISFYIFKAVSYIIDVYRGKIFEKNFAKYVLYVSFFPQIVSGPIQRSTELIPQFSVEHKFNPKMIENGLCMMLIGYLKKMVIADNLAGIVSKVFTAPEGYSPIVLIFIACIYSVQIYCDFSGYSDIAIGCASVFGIKTEKNFDNPYFSLNIADFWRKWHISLSSWFKEYLYIPLGGNRKGVARKYINVLVVFLVSGLWHGAAWNFIFWGFLHGMYQVIGKCTQNIRNKFWNLMHLDEDKKLRKIIGMITTFMLVTFAWIFFKADTIEDGINYIKCIFINKNNVFSISAIIQQVKMLFNTKIVMNSFLIAIMSFTIFVFVDYKRGVCYIFGKANTFIKVILYSLLITFIVLFAATGVLDFIYIRF